MNTRSLIIVTFFSWVALSCDSKRAVVHPPDSPRGPRVAMGATPKEVARRRPGMDPGAIKAIYRGAFPKKRKVGFHPARLIVSGVPRKVTVYFPAKVAAKPALIIACHGTGGTAEDGVWDIAANEAADAHGAIVVSLQARHMPRGDWDNHKAGQVFFETYPNTSLRKNNDLLLVLATIAEGRRAYGIDPKRVYIAGFSNGAFFAQFAALALREHIAGFASSAGGLVRCRGTGTCGFRGSALTCAALRKEPGYCACKGQDKPFPMKARARKPAAYLVHSVRDDTVSSYYSCELAARLLALGHPVKLALRRHGDHGSPPHFMVAAWKFLSKYPLR